jgi:hypothetical protein
MRTLHRFVATILFAVIFTTSTSTAYASAPAYEAGTAVAAGAGQSPYVWVARFFMRELTSWVVSKGFDEAARRLGLIRRGRDAVYNLSVISNTVSVPNSERARISAMAQQIQQMVSALERTDRSNDQVRYDLAVLQQQMRRSFDQMEREIRELDQHLTELELQQSRQLKMIVDTQGRVVQLERQVVDHEGRIISLENRVGDLGQRTRALEETVNPDPNRFLRHEWTLSGSAIYANSTVLPNDASIGGQLSAQYNMSKTFGVFADLFWAPVTASDAEGFDAGSRMYWESYGVVAGLSMNLLPPQSFVSLQLSGGGGIVQSSLSEYPEGVSISDPDGGFELGSVSNAALIGKAELGIGPPAVGIEPFAAFGYLRFIDDLAYADNETTTNAGNQLWYISLGVRLRLYDRRHHTPIAEARRQPPALDAPAR